MKLLAPIILALPLAASAATMTVNTTADNLAGGDGKCTVREAIANVNAAADTTDGDCAGGTATGDTIVFNLALHAAIHLTLGQLTVQRDVTVTGVPNGALRIDGTAKTRVFEIVAGTTTISNVTIHHGRSPDSGGGTYAGGGILVDSGAALTLTDCILSANSAGHPNGASYSTGGAIYNAGALALDRCVLVGNTAGNTHGGDSEGGGIYNASTGTLYAADCNLAGNGAFGGPFDDRSVGGAISNHGTMTLSNCTINRNQSRVVYQVRIGGSGTAAGGGIENQGDTTLDGCTLGQNLAGSGSASGDAEGGGLDNSGTVILTASAFIGNSVRGGVEAVTSGGGLNNYGTATVSNCTFAANFTRTGANGISSGGGIKDGGSLTVINSTLSGNVIVGSVHSLEHAEGAGIDSFGALVTNSIIVASGPVGNCSGITSGGHNLSDDGSCFASGGTDLANTNPLLAPLRNYGGPTETLALCVAAQMPHPACTGPSPAIDAGDDGVTGPPDNLTTDQRGLPRLSGTHVDIGAYEAQ